MSYRLGHSVLERLVNREILTPHIEKIVQQNKWPEKYEVNLPQHGSGRDGLFHPSSHTMGDERWLYMQIHPEARTQLIRRPFDYTSTMTMSAGTAMHAILQTQMVMGGLCDQSDIEVPIFCEEHHYTGHMDARVTLGSKTYPVDIKTTNPVNFDRLTKPYENYILQLLCYMYEQQQEEGIILFVEFARPFRMKEFIVRMDDENKLKLRKLFEKWDYVWNCVQENKVPGYCCAPGSKKSVECNAAAICYGDDA